MAKAVKPAKPAARASRKLPPRSPSAQVQHAPSKSGLLKSALLIAAALAAAFLAYAPSLSGDFVFDDRNMPMLYGNAATYPFRAWLGTRPLLMASYYLNFRISGIDTTSYHVVNVLLHVACSVFAFYIVRRILGLAGIDAQRRSLVALFTSGLFLLHPVQTEAVSYIASRSETLSVLFFFAAFTVFLYRRKPAITFLNAAAILFLYFCAMTSKEHTAVLPAVLLLTDYTWNPGFSFAGIRRNWKLYVPISVAALLGLLLFRIYIGKGSNIGFGLTGLTWYQYLFTEFRAIFVYLRMFLLPYGQNVDYNFPVSHNLLDHGALFYGLALFAISAACFVYRKRFPLAFYGWFMALILLAPTSSFVPIKDPLADRRMYLPFIGFLLIACQIILHFRWQRRTGMAVAAALLAICALLTWHRNGAWINMESLWKDSVAKNPDNPRALLGLGDSYAARNQCAEAIPYFERAIKLENNYQLTYNLASAHDCANQLPAALSGYQAAVAMRPTAEAWAHIGLIDMKSYKFDDAFDAFDRAQHITPGFVLTYDYRGILYLALGRFDEARGQFQFALVLDPSDTTAQRGLVHVNRHERQF